MQDEVNSHHERYQITDIRDQSRANVTENRDGIFTEIRHHDDMIDGLSDKRRAAFRIVLSRLIAEGKVNSRADWCKKAGQPIQTVADFDKGITPFLNEIAYKRLADYAGISVLELKGESEPLRFSDEDIETIGDLRALPPEDRDRWRQLIKAQARLVGRGERTS